MRILLIASISPNAGVSGQFSGEMPLQLGQRGSLAERGIREIIAKLGQAAKLTSPLGLHDLRHTFAKVLLDPNAEPS